MAEVYEHILEGEELCRGAITLYNAYLSSRWSGRSTLLGLG